MDNPSQSFKSTSKDENLYQIGGLPLTPFRRRTQSAPPNTPNTPYTPNNPNTSNMENQNQRRVCQRGVDSLCEDPQTGIEHHNYLGLVRHHEVRVAEEPPPPGERKNLCPLTAGLQNSQNNESETRDGWVVDPNQRQFQYQGFNVPEEFLNDTTNYSDGGGRRLRLNEIFPQMTQQCEHAMRYPYLQNEAPIGHFEPAMSSTRCEGPCRQATARPANQVYRMPTPAPAPPPYRPPPQFSGRPPPEMHQTCPQAFNNQMDRSRLQRSCPQPNLPQFPSSPQSMHDHSEVPSQYRFQPRPFPQQAPPCDIPNFNRFQIPPEMRYRPVVRPFQQPEPVWDGSELENDCSQNQQGFNDTQYRQLPPHPLPPQQFPNPRIAVQQASFGGPVRCPTCADGGTSSRGAVSRSGLTPSVQFRSPGNSIHNLNQDVDCPPGCEPVRPTATSGAMSGSSRQPCPMTSSQNAQYGMSHGSAPCNEQQNLSAPNLPPATEPCGQCSAASRQMPQFSGNQSLPHMQRPYENTEPHRSQSYGAGLNLRSNQSRRNINAQDGKAEERFSDRIQKIQIEELVLDKSCPGAIQATLNGQENFNDYAYELIFAGVIPKSPKPIDPVTMIEAIKIRIDLNRKEISNKQSGKDRVSPADVDTYFHRKNKTEVNEAISAFLKADAMYSQSYSPRGHAFKVDINKTEANFFGAPIKMDVLTGVTEPIE